MPGTSPKFLYIFLFILINVGFHIIKPRYCVPLNDQIKRPVFYLIKSCSITFQSKTSKINLNAFSLSLYFLQNRVNSVFPRKTAFIIWKKPTLTTSFFRS